MTELNARHFIVALAIVYGSPIALILWAVIYGGGIRK